MKRGSAEKLGPGTFNRGFFFELRNQVLLPAFHTCLESISLHVRLSSRLQDIAYSHDLTVNSRMRFSQYQQPGTRFRARFDKLLYGTVMQKVPRPRQDGQHQNSPTNGKRVACSSQSSLPQSVRLLSPISIFRLRGYQKVGNSIEDPGLL